MNVAPSSQTLVQLRPPRRHPSLAASRPHREAWEALKIAPFSRFETNRSCGSRSDNRLNNVPRLRGRLLTLTGKSRSAHSAYSTYAKATALRRDNLRRSADVLRAQLAKAKKALLGLGEAN